MKAITLAVAAVMAVSCFSGCANLRTRTAPAKACLTNACGGFGPCTTACAPAPMMPQLPPPPPQYPYPTLEK